MSLPGVTVQEVQSAGSGDRAVNASTWFVTGFTERGLANTPTLIRSLKDLKSVFGGRVSYGMVYDAADVFFQEGGDRMYVSRVVGPTPSNAEADLSDGNNTTAKVEANTPGVWGDSLSVTVAVNGPSFNLTVLESSTAVEKSPDCSTVAALADWSQSSRYITVTDLSGDNPVAATTSLTGGADDHSAAADTHWQTALDAFAKDLGPGQVSAPGRTTAPAHQSLLEHAEAGNRVALLDGLNTGTAASLISAASTDRALAVADWGGVFAPWAVVPGVAPGTLRTVPYSAVQAGLIARSDSRGKSPNVAAAGANGRSRYAVGLSQSPWSDSDREALNDAGVNVALMKDGAVTTYGYRTLSAEAQWLQLSNRRLYTVIAARADAIAEQYVFAEIDGKGLVFSRLAGDLTGMLMDYYPGSLYGDTFSEAAVVDTGPGVNTPQTIADLEINAVIKIRMSPFGEQVIIGINKTLITEAI